MAQRITFYIDQGSSATITATFSLRSAPLIPDDLRWSLTDEEGSTINARRDVPLAPASSIPIVLTGGDLATLEPFDTLLRIVTVQGHYTSIDGAGLTLAGEYRFSLNRLVGS